jgi:hypothetical protein
LGSKCVQERRRDSTGGEAVCKDPREPGGKGELTIDDPDLAAQHFVWLMLGLPLDRGMFDVDRAAPAVDELDRIADAGLRGLLSAYGA